MSILFGYIGVYSPLILFLATLVLLQNMSTTLYYFVAGFILNNALNILLKIAFKEPRPDGDQKAIEIGVANGVRFGHDKFGMPSGHAQNCAYCLTFITMTLNSPAITGIYSVITLLSCIQRYVYKNHTVLQLIIGLLVGLTFGFLLYQITNNALKGNIKMKRDDYAPK